MHIYIDESGVFKAASNAGAWCAVVAFVVPEANLGKVRSILTPFKLACKKSYSEEIKLGEMSEDIYFKILSALGRLDCTVYCVSTDMSLLTEHQISTHQREQANRIVTHIEKMKFEEGRRSLRTLSDEIASLSPQLYMQLVCQVMLVKEVIDRGILYHVQRDPKCLRQFRWRIDQKNTTKSSFEVAFEKIAPSLLQSMSMQEPSIACVDFDYSAMDDFIYNETNAPTYLKDTYGIDVDACSGLNVGKVFRSDLAFPDSKSETGLQIADLIASGIGRLLRGRFNEPATAARLLGSLMVENIRGKYPLQLVSFVNERTVSDEIATIVKNLTKNVKPMLFNVRNKYNR